MTFNDCEEASSELMKVPGYILTRNVQLSGLSL